MVQTVTLIHKKKKKVSGFKIEKERLTVMACSNTLGSLILSLTVICRSAKSRYFKNTKIKDIPVLKRHQKST